MVQVKDKYLQAICDFPFYDPEKKYLFPDRKRKKSGVFPCGNFFVADVRAVYVIARSGYLYP